MQRMNKHKLKLFVNKTSNQMRIILLQSVVNTIIKCDNGGVFKCNKKGKKFNFLPFLIKFTFFALSN